MTNSIATQDPAYDKAVEKAIAYLVDAFMSSGHNPKPVILHSIRTGLYLYDQNYSQDVVVAAILHDLIEDTDATEEDLEKRIGPEVARLVAANSFNSEMMDRDQRDIDMLDRCKQGGKWALLIKAADILDNSAYFRLRAEEEQSHWLLWKMRYFLELSADELANEPVYLCLKTRYEDMVRSTGINL
jgi:(p)ppGpp synthase/HD superfamily hydrolase